MPETSDSPEIMARLRQFIETVDIANMLTAPITDSIRNLLATSAAAIGSSEASVLVRDGEEGALRFLAAVGSVAEQLLDMKIPAGKGIAGFVLSSGQPVAVSDVGGEETFYAEVDKQTGFLTQMILATPLRYDGDVIGVLEYINRSGDPPHGPFTPAEMDQAAVYADAIASLVNAYNFAHPLREFSDRLFSEDHATDLDSIRSWLADAPKSGQHSSRLELAVLLREIVERGEAERELCRQILESLLKYSSEKSDGSYLGY